VLFAGQYDPTNILSHGRSIKLAGGQILPAGHDTIEFGAEHNNPAGHNSAVRIFSVLFDPCGQYSPLLHG
jgi:hypothetical protein